MLTRYVNQFCLRAVGPYRLFVKKNKVQHKELADRDGEIKVIIRPGFSRTVLYFRDVSWSPGFNSVLDLSWI